MLDVKHQVGVKAWEIPSTPFLAGFGGLPTMSSAPLPPGGPTERDFAK